MINLIGFSSQTFKAAFGESVYSS